MHNRVRRGHDLPCGTRDFSLALVTDTLGTAVFLSRLHQGSIKSSLIK